MKRSTQRVTSRHLLWTLRDDGLWFLPWGERVVAELVQVLEVSQLLRLALKGWEQLPGDMAPRRTDLELCISRRQTQRRRDRRCPRRTDFVRPTSLPWRGDHRQWRRNEREWWCLGLWLNTRFHCCRRRRRAWRPLLLDDCGGKKQNGIFRVGLDGEKWRRWRGSGSGRGRGTVVAFQ